MKQRWKPAVTVAAVIEQAGKFLVVEEDTADGVRWNQPAGHLEPGETLCNAVIREAMEETAHPFLPQGVLGVYLATTGGATYLRFAFVGQVAQPVNQPLDHGIRRAFWVTADQLRANPQLHRSPLVMRCVDDYIDARSQGRPWLPLESLAYMGEQA